MKKYAIIVDDSTGLCNVGIGDNTAYYKSIGMSEYDVTLAYDGNYYLTNKCPKKVYTEDDINKLTMTALDLVQLIMKAGVSATTIRDFLEANAELDLMLKCCKDVYCGIVRQKLPIKIGTVEITDTMVVKAFKDKHGIQ